MLTHPVQSIKKQLIKIKNDIIFIFTVLCGASERFHLEAPKRSVGIKSLCHFFPYSIGTTRAKTVFCQTSHMHTISVYLPIEIHKNNIDILELLINSTIKKYYSKSFYQTKLIFSESHLQILDFLQENFTRQYFFLSQM